MKVNPEWVIQPDETTTVGTISSAVPINTTSGTTTASTSSGGGDQDNVPSINLEELKWNLVSPVYSVEGDAKRLSKIITPRVGHAIVNGKAGTRKAYMIGGGNFDGELSDIWTLDFSGNNVGFLKVSLRSANNLTGRYEFSTALDHSKNVIYIFGGSDIKDLMNDVLELNIDTNSILEKSPPDTSIQPAGNSNIPSPRTQGNNFTLVDIKGKKLMAVFGGGLKGERSVPDGNLYLFDTEACSWRKVNVNGSTPSPRQGHLMVSFQTKVFVYGGLEGVDFFSDLYMIDLQEESPSWIKLPQEAEVGTKKPCGRAAHGGFIKGSNIYILGGLSENGSLCDFWKYNIDSHLWTEIKVAGKLPQMYDFAVNIITTWNNANPDEKHDVILVHGGMSDSGMLNEFWMLPLGSSN